MNITTVYFSKEQWFNIFSLFNNQQLLFLIMCPINLIGVTLNLLTFVILTKNEFGRMLVYKYLRIYSKYLYRKRPYQKPITDKPKIKK
jgi:protein associated with RNAse G/E